MTGRERREEPRPDRLPEIRRLLKRRSDGEWSGTFTTSGCEDVAWLVAEVERLRAEAGQRQALWDELAKLGVIS